MPQVAHGNPCLQPRNLTSDTAKIQLLKTYACSLSTTVSADRFTGTSPPPPTPTGPALPTITVDMP